MFFIKGINRFPMFFEMLRENRVNISADGNTFFGGKDIHDFGNLGMNFPADIDALARFDLIAF